MTLNDHERRNSSYFAFFSRNSTDFKADYITVVEDRPISYVNRVLMKLFKSSNIDIINVCRDMFNFRLPSELLACRSEKFLFNVATDVCLR